MFYLAVLLYNWVCDVVHSLGWLVRRRDDPWGWIEVVEQE